MTSMHASSWPEVADWIVQNPPQQGVNWACAMDVAIRAVNWLWGFYFFEDSAALTDEFKLTFAGSLLAHGRHIMSNLEWFEEFTGNHYLSDIVGLIYLGILLPELKEARRWLEFGLAELEKEMFRQVYPDGVDFEASVSYHRLVTELFLSAVLLAQLNGHTFSPPFMQRLERMIEVVMDLTRPDGTAPLIGDADNGRLHRLTVWAEVEREWADYRYLLAIGAVMFGRDDFAAMAGDQWQEAFWLLGERAATFKEGRHSKGVPPPERRSKEYPDAGLYVIQNDDCHMVIAAGPNGQCGNGGHTHNDKLAITLYAEGQEWLIDPGSYVYTSDYEERSLFRSTAYHSTVQVDGQEQSRIDVRKPFWMADDAHPAVQRWESTASYDLLDASHDGYPRLRAPIVHRRQVFFAKGAPRFWLIRDTLSGTGHHDYSLRFHLGDVVARVGPSLAVTLDGKANNGRLLIIPVLTDGLAVRLDDASHVPGYGQKTPSKIVHYTKSGPAPAQFITVLWPCAITDTLESTVARARAAASGAAEQLDRPPRNGEVV